MNTDFIAQNFSKYHPNTFIQNELVKQIGVEHSLNIASKLSTKNFKSLEVISEGSNLKFRNQKNFLIESYTFDKNTSLPFGFRFYAIRFCGKCFLYSDVYFLLKIKSELVLTKIPVNNKLQTRA